jgi:hypothetical protein
VEGEASAAWAEESKSMHSCRNAGDLIDHRIRRLLPAYAALTVWRTSQPSSLLRGLPHRPADFSERRTSTAKVMEKLAAAAGFTLGRMQGPWMT